MRLSPGRTAIGVLILGWALIQRSRGQRLTRTADAPQIAYTPVFPHPYRLPKGAIAAFVLVLLAIAAGYGLNAYKESRDRERLAARLTGGDPSKAEAHVTRYGCAGCHTIPGISRANGLVGPPLTSLSARVYIGGMLPNSPDNLVHWIVNPREVNPKTAMPVTGISEDEARDVAAYLYTLR